MIKLCLIGKNISHSRSSQVYRELLKQDIDYHLLDCQDTSEIPSLSHLFDQFCGVSITAPYKTYFLEKVCVSATGKLAGAINCIKKSIDGTYCGTNTDILAVEELLLEFKVAYDNLHVILLGSGTMSLLTQKLLNKLNITYDVLSRRIRDDFAHMNLAQEYCRANTQYLVVNSCCREYLFSGKLSANFIFWNYNYAHPEQQSRVIQTGARYIDGYELLVRQAKFALKFWKISE